MTSRILVKDSSPLTSPGEDERGARAQVFKANNRTAHAMNGSGHFAKTNFTKSLSPSLSPPAEKSKSNGDTIHALNSSSSHSATAAPASSSASPFSSSSSSKLTSMAARINAKSSNALPPRASSSGSHAQMRSSNSPALEDSDQSSQNSFKASIQKFAYQHSNGVKRSSPIVINEDQDGDESSHLSSEGSKTKKRRFIRGGRKAIKNAMDSEDEGETEMTSAAQSLSVNPSSQVDDHVGEQEVEKNTEHIVRHHPSWEKDRIRRVLKETRSGGKVNTLVAMETLKKYYASDGNGSNSSLTYRPSPALSSRPDSKSPQRTASYLKSPGVNKPVNRLGVGKGIQVTSKFTTPPQPLAIPALQEKVQSKTLPKKLSAISRDMERVKSSNTASARSSISISDGDSDGDSSDDSYDRKSKEESKALQWFNQVDEKQLMDIVGVNADQAATIVEMRPFTSTDDVTSKLGDKSAKGVSPKLFYNCVDLMSGLQEVDSVLEKCEKMGNKLNAVLEGWKSTPVVGDNDQDFLHGQPEGLSEGVLLKDFQLHGVNWLYLLYRRECSGILADDMGLGKTAQVIAFLNVVVSKLKQGPHLIVVPSSVLTNWMREFEMFGPDLNVFKYHGSQSERSIQQREMKDDRNEIDVVITTYEMASGGERDHTFLRKFGFEACIYDEGHILKNQKSIKYTKLVKIKAKWRLLLTGTPLQNNLGELISLLKFIMPSYFRGAEEALGQIFKVNHQSQLSRERVNRAKKMMQPFVLRRKKIDVLLDLKPKTEVVKYCDMTPDQGKLYKEAFAKSRAAIRQQQQEIEEAAATTTTTTTRSKKTATTTTSKAKSGHVLMELRKAANHPLLFRRLYTDAKIEALARDYLKNADHADEDLAMKKEDFSINSDAELSMSVAGQYKTCQKHMLESKQWLNSGKISALKEVIEEAASRGERLIIFSQFVQTLEIICRALEVMGITYRGFTGSTDVGSRQEIVDEFTQDSSIRCFLLSTRAGGVGINLTAANWVVLFDQDFNPQNDRQAADRAYRIGQVKQVTIVRLISKNTIDEQILELGKSKLKLAERVEGADEDVDESAANQEEVEARVEQTLLARLAHGDDDEDGRDMEVVEE